MENKQGKICISRQKNWLDGTATLIVNDFTMLPGIMQIWGKAAPGLGMAKESRPISGRHGQRELAQGNLPALGIFAG